MRYTCYNCGRTIDDETDNPNDNWVCECGINSWSIEWGD